MSDELAEIETTAPTFGITSQKVGETVVTTLVTAATLAVVSVVAGFVKAKLENRKNSKTDDPS